MPHVRTTDLADHRNGALPLENVLAERRWIRPDWLVHADAAHPPCLYPLGRRTSRLAILEIDRPRHFGIPIVRIQDDQGFVAFVRSRAGRRHIAVGEKPDPLPELPLCRGLLP